MYIIKFIIFNLKNKVRAFHNPIPDLEGRYWLEKQEGKLMLEGNLRKQVANFILSEKKSRQNEGQRLR